MKLFFQLFNFRLPNIRVEGFLHFTFKLIFSFPQKNLSLTFNNFVHKLSFFLTNPINVDFQFNGLSFHFFEFLNELTFKINVFILKFTFFFTVDCNIVIKFVHLLLKAFKIDFDFFNFSFKGSVIII